MFIPAVNTAKVTFGQSQADGSYAQNSIYVEADAAWDATTISDLATLCALEFGVNVLPQTSQDVTLTSVTARDLTTADSPESVFNPTSENVGGQTDHAIEMGLTFALTLRTGLSGRSYRGRVFAIGIPTGSVPDVSLNLLGSVDATDLAAAWMSMITAINGSTPGALTIQAVVASFYSGVVGGVPVPRDNAVLTPITAVGYSDLFLDFQRRRAPGHNRHR